MRIVSGENIMGPMVHAFPYNLPPGGIKIDCLGEVNPDNYEYLYNEDTHIYWFKTHTSKLNIDSSQTEIGRQLPSKDRVAFKTDSSKGLFVQVDNFLINKHPVTSEYGGEYQCQALDDTERITIHRITVTDIPVASTIEIATVIIFACIVCFILLMLCVLICCLIKTKKRKNKKCKQDRRIEQRVNKKVDDEFKKRLGTDLPEFRQPLMIKTPMMGNSNNTSYEENNQSLLNVRRETYNQNQGDYSNLHANRKFSEIQVPARENMKPYDQVSINQDFF